MGLKIAVFEKTNQWGSKENVFLTVRKFNDLDLILGGQVGLCHYENGEEAKRINGKGLWFINVSAEQIQSVMMENGVVGFLISDKIWEIAQTQKFIPDYELNEAKTAYVLVMKSLDDFGVTPIEI